MTQSTSVQSEGSTVPQISRELEQKIMTEMWPRVRDRLNPTLVNNALNQFFPSEILPNPPGWLSGDGMKIWDRINEYAASIATSSGTFETCIPGIWAMAPEHVLSPDPEPVYVVYLYLVCQMATVKILTQAR